MKKLINAYQQYFGESPKKTGTPMERGDHPELDDTSLLEPKDIRIYQSLVGALQWCITLGRYDVMMAVMTMSRFRAQPRTGHLRRVKRIIGFLHKHPNAAIRFRTGIPDNERIFGYQDKDWDDNVYEGCREDIDMRLYPTPRGRPMRLTP